MTLETVTTAWMEPATLWKKRETRSERLGRRVLGEKGVGRFAASRLASQLSMVTKRAEARTQIVMSFDWTQFDDPNLYLDQVRVPWYEETPDEFSRKGSIGALWDRGQIPTPTNLGHGTILRMEGLNSDWGDEEFRRLRTGLSRLVSPFSRLGQVENISPANDFVVRLDVSEPFSHFSGPIDPPETIENSNYSLHGHVNEEGGYRAEVSLKNGKSTKVVVDSSMTKQSCTNCGPFEIELRVWDRDASSLGEIAKIRDSTIRDVRGDLNAMAGITVYRDGFRVLPYGETGNDWLSLDARRVQNPTLRLSNNQIVGHVLIGQDTNPNLRDQSNREGLIEGPALEELRLKVKELLAELEVRRFDLRAEERGNKKRPSGMFVGFDLSDVISQVRRKHPGDTELLDLLSEKGSDLDRRVEEVQVVLSRYHRLATLGGLVDMILHDGRAPMGKIAQAAMMAKKDMQRVRGLSTIAAERLMERLDIVSSQIERLGDLFRKIEPFGGRRRGRPSRIVLESVIRDAFSVLSSDCHRVGVDLELPRGSTSLTVQPSDIQEIIVILLQNSLYWLEYVDKCNRHIQVDVRRKTPDETQIVFSDSGPGVDPQFAQSIFEPYFSTKPNGVGLGLSIAGDIISEYYGGDIELLKSSELPGATFRITLRKGA